MTQEEQTIDKQASAEMARRVRGIVAELGRTMGGITEAEMGAMVIVAAIRARSFGMSHESWTQVCEAAWADVDAVWGKAQALVAMRREAHEP